MVCNCWRKTEILPNSLLNDGPAAAPTVTITSLINADPVETALAAAEQEVSNLLSHLEKIGVLQPQNQMALDELLNPIDENIMHNDGTDKDICDTVLEQHQAEQT
ncbi:hypothetical protein C0992_000852, partial [Termitomyces sp. T32_za158]